MKALLFSILFLISMGGCMKSEVNAPLAKCNFSFETYVEKTLKDAKGTVRLDSTGSNQSYRIYLEEGHLPERVNPCNLPENYKADGLEVLFSGDLLNNPLISFSAQPLELKSIQPVIL